MDTVAKGDTEAEKYIYQLKKKLNLEHIKGHLEKLKSLNVLVIGDAVLDEYIFVWPKGRAIKDPILSTEFRSGELYAGGIMAIANHVSDYVKKVTMVTLIGDTNSYVDFIKKSLKPNVELKSFVKAKSYTTLKRRYVDHYRNSKLFKIEYINDKPIDEKLTSQVVDYLESEVPKYDLVVVGDFGHGFLNKPIKQELRKLSKFLAVNTQSNSSNMGYNYFTHYEKPDFMTLSEEELRLPLAMRFEEIEKVATQGRKDFEMKNFVVTLGKKGSLYSFNNKLFKAPVLTSSVKDTVGAGDALFALTSLFAYSKAEPELIPFIGNCAGGIAANIMGNKESVTKDKLLEFAGGLLK
jgi:bifunctional ADP-heptose synthase (sugar kinase/adenylyltransferase)